MSSTAATQGKEGTSLKLTRLYSSLSWHIKERKAWLILAFPCTWGMPYSQLPFSRSSWRSWQLLPRNIPFYVTKYWGILRIIISGFFKRVFKKLLEFQQIFNAKLLIKEGCTSIFPEDTWLGGGRRRQNVIPRYLILGLIISPCAT